MGVNQPTAWIKVGSSSLYRTTFRYSDRTVVNKDPYRDITLSRQSVHVTLPSDFTPEMVEFYRSNLESIGYATEVQNNG